MSDESDDRYWEDRPRRRSDDDWRDDRPRRRRYGDDRDDYDEQYGYSDPRQKVQGPAIAFVIVGWLGVLGSLVLAAFGIFMLVATMNNVAARNSDDAIAAIFVIALGICSAAVCVLLAIAGARMRQCRSWGLSMAAAILAVASIAVVGLCSVVILPFGIWALVVLNNADVKREFRRVGRKGKQESHDYID